MKINTEDIESILVFAYMNNMKSMDLEEIYEIMQMPNTNYKLPKDKAEYNQICFKLGLL